MCRGGFAKEMVKEKAKSEEKSQERLLTWKTRIPFFWQTFFKLLLCVRCCDKSVNIGDKYICYWWEIDKNITNE